MDSRALTLKKIVDQLGATEEQRTMVMEVLAKAAGTNLRAVRAAWNVHPEPTHVSRFRRLAEEEGSRRLNRQRPPLGGDHHWQYWIDGMNDSVLTVSAAVEREGFTWCNPASDPFLFDTEPEWLMRIQGTAWLLRDHMPDSRTDALRFDSPSLGIILVRSGRLAHAWVGRLGTGVAVEFDTQTFHLRGRTEEPAFKTAAGCAIAWYVDSCFPRPRNQLDLPMMLESEVEKLSLHTWAPADAFNRRVEVLREGSPAQALAHWVVPHVRTLSVGFPNPEHVGAAPEFLRERMGPDDTWVTGHVRNIEQIDRLLRSLKGRSVLADAVGSTAWLTYNPLH